MIKKEATDIIKKHFRKLTATANDMKLQNKNAGRIFITREDILELSAICILSFNYLTGVDLQEEPFTREEDDLK